MRENAFALQHAVSRCRGDLFGCDLRASVFAVAGADQRSGVFGNIQRLLQMLIVDPLPPYPSSRRKFRANWRRLLKRSGSFSKLPNM